MYKKVYTLKILLLSGCASLHFSLLVMAIFLRMQNPGGVHVCRYNMEKTFNIPPKNPRDIMSANDLALCLKNLIGKSVKITGKPRTDGSTIRKLVTDCLSVYSTCEAAKETDYETIPPRGKGIPRLLLELVDTYIITSGANYNLQVWNRFPNSKSALIEYKNGKKNTCV